MRMFSLTGAGCIVGPAVILLLIFWPVGFFLLVLTVALLLSGITKKARQTMVCQQCRFKWESNKVKKQA